ncbi:hypothetical protein DRQ36_07210 [bacterium]|nr:MAG: hypothetical protein DRQ36_07210 [bacterium]
MWKRAKASFFALIALFVLVLLFRGEFGLLSLYRYSRFEKTLERQLAAEQARGDSLEQVLYRLKTDPEFLERMARERLNMIKDNERVYRFKETEIDK